MAVRFMRMSALSMVALAFACSSGGPDATTPTRAQNSSGDDGSEGDDASCSSEGDLAGVDVSHHQGTVDWNAVKTAGNTFAFMSVGDGTTTPDARFPINWANARTAGMLRGAYQYFRPDQDVTAQATGMVSAINTAGGLATTDLPPVLDFEETGGLSNSEVVPAAKSWLEAVEDQTGRHGIVYTTTDFLTQIGHPSALSSYPLWLASYDATCPKVSGWSKWTFWQTSANAAVDGIDGPTFTDVFNGTGQGLRAFINTTVIDASKATAGDPSGNGGAGSGDDGGDDVGNAGAGTTGGGTTGFAGRDGTGDDTSSAGAPDTTGDDVSAAGTTGDDSTIAGDDGGPVDGNGDPSVPNATNLDPDPANTPQGDSDDIAALQGYLPGGGSTNPGGGDNSTSASSGSSGDDSSMGAVGATGNAAVDRAQLWVMAEMPYCGGVNGGSDAICGGTCTRTGGAQKPEWDVYRSDCSGLVSWAWGLPAPGATTATVMQSATQIDPNTIAAGDALLRVGHHIILFVNWADDSHATVIEEMKCGKVATIHQIDLAVSGSNLTSSRGTFVPIRKK